MNRRPVRLALVWLACLGAGGCVADGTEGRLLRHGVAGVWSDAVVGTTDNPWQWGTAAVLVAATPFAFAHDLEWSDSAIDHTWFSSRHEDGTALLNGMMGVSGAVAVSEWLIGEDGGMAAEVLVESTAVTAGVVELIKHNKSRRRPRGSTDNKSFPSGHASIAFSSATFLARRIDDAFDDWRGSLGYLMYVPAAAVMLNRVETARHYPSDVLVGALIGSIATNVIYNAHYGSDGRRRIAPPLSVVTSIDDDSVGIGLQFRF